MHDRKKIDLQGIEGDLYSAPELFKHGFWKIDRDQIDFAVDSWSIGVILYEMSICKKPFENIPPVQHKTPEIKI